MPGICLPSEAVGRRLALSITVLGSMACGAATPASANGPAAPILPGVVIHAGVKACDPSLCVVGGGGGQGASTVTDLANFGVDYTRSGSGTAPTQMNVTTPGELSVADASSIVIGSTPSLTATTFNGPGPSGYGVSYATSQLTYFFEVLPVLGAGGPVVVDVRALGRVSSATTGAGNEGYADAQLTVNGVKLAVSTIDYSRNTTTKSNSSTPDVVANIGYASTATGGFSVNRDLNLATGSIYSVVMEADANVLYQDGTGGFATATGSIDPVFTVPVGYDIYFSPGVSNVEAGVPEPAVWTLIAVGFGCLGGSLRRRGRASERSLPRAAKMG